MACTILSKMIRQILAYFYFKDGHVRLTAEKRLMVFNVWDDGNSLSTIRKFQT